MQKIQDLLNRIQWDKEFGKGRFEIGYYDRVADKIIRVSFAEILLPAADRFSFQVKQEFAGPVSIPFHRVRKVWENGSIIWERK